MIYCLTAILFTLTYVALAFGRVPGLRIDRAGIALVGATLMLFADAHDRRRCYLRDD